MELLEFKDPKSVSDKIYSYTSDLLDNHVPIVIDNGSYMCRAGWATSSNPLLQFKNLLAKPRRERTKKDTVEISQVPQLQVGNDIGNIEAVRFQLKTQFDRNIVTHFEVQEHIFDYTFAHLGIDTESCVEHSVVCTEAVLNPNSSRQLMSELLFECYKVPAVAFGVDALFSYHFLHGNQNVKPLENALIVHLGYQTCHIIPVLNNKTIFENTRRLNTGGFHIISFLHRILQLKYPAHATSITLSRAEELLHRICSVAVNYREELCKWTDTDYYEKNILKIQLPYTASAITTAVTLEQQKERKRELARRLTEINARKREERLAEDEDKLGQLLDIKNMIKYGAEREVIEQMLHEFQLKNVQELDKSIMNLNMKIDRTKQKILAASTVTEEVDEPPIKQSKYNKMSFDSEQDLHIFLQNIRKARQEILTKKMMRKQRKQDMAKRRTAAGQERMRIISQLARKEKGNDDFGLRDEDWDIYKTISKDGGDSDSDAENEKLIELEEVLRIHEPSELGESSNPGETHQLHVGIERYRAPELLFKPYMLGSQEAGLSEVIGYVFSLFGDEDQLKLAKNVVVSGGLANLKGLRERLLADLISVRPFRSEVNVTVLKECGLSSWFGARNFAQSEVFKNHKVTRKMYEEYGADYFISHIASNPYYKTPNSIDIDIDK